MRDRPEEIPDGLQLGAIEAREYLVISRQAAKLSAKLGGMKQWQKEGVSQGEVGFAAVALLERCYAVPPKLIDLVRLLMPPVVSGLSELQQTAATYEGEQGAKNLLIGKANAKNKRGWPWPTLEEVCSVVGEKQGPVKKWRRQDAYNGRRRFVMIEETNLVPQLLARLAKADKK